MVQQKQSVVTPERFSKGLTYAQYLDAIERNRARFEENYAGTEIPADLVARLKALVARPDGPKKLMVLGEDWCPDVFRGMPVFARIAEAAGLELRVFMRDQHKDIMAEYMNAGEFESIPVAVFYSQDFEELAQWIERPALATQQMHELAPMYARLRKADKTPEEAAAAKQEYIDFQNGPVWGGWRIETVRECLDRLEAKLS
ncbi:MAG: thioredoxin family protein [Dehalococcoidia bacterium]